MLFFGRSESRGGGVKEAWGFIGWFLYKGIGIYRFGLGSGVVGFFGNSFVLF